MPCTRFKCNPFEVGQTLTVNGVPKAGAEYFHVDIGSDSDVVLRIEPRFTAGQVIFNTLKNGNWKENVVHSGIPFKHGQDFTITVLFKHEEFVVTLPDGTKINYPNSFKADKYCLLTLNGEVEFRNIEMK
ncbi:beta-galactoside-binding lectin-like [Synchiropus splendidus]|uniref:beta-galactoside-binding lectin-like n=1 Tax=Synchiropus splendidus TaxID=270530 RepID=UPI00237D6814|nr:beta-galactoside-binding lectin-like [Synchiropus splendidus]